MILRWTNDGLNWRGHYGAVPRIYTLYTGGNDGEAWLLDPRIVAAIAESGMIKEGGIPALATHD